MAEVLSAKELAIELGCDARTARKFLRDIVPPEEQPGQGGRWTFTPKQAKRFRRARGDDKELEQLLEETEEVWDEGHLQETDKAWDAIHRCLTDDFTPDGQLDPEGFAELCALAAGGPL